MKVPAPSMPVSSAAISTCCVGAAPGNQASGTTAHDAGQQRGMARGAMHGARRGAVQDAVAIAHTSWRWPRRPVSARRRTRAAGRAAAPRGRPRAPSGCCRCWPASRRASAAGWRSAARRAAGPTRDRGRRRALAMPDLRPGRSMREGGGMRKDIAAGRDEESFVLIGSRRPVLRRAAVAELRPRSGPSPRPCGSRGRATTSGLKRSVSLGNSITTVEPSRKRPISSPCASVDLRRRA